MFKVRLTSLFLVSIRLAATDGAYNVYYVFNRLLTERPKIALRAFLYLFNIMERYTLLRSLCAILATFGGAGRAWLYPPPRTEPPKSEVGTPYLMVCLSLTFLPFHFLFYSFPLLSAIIILIIYMILFLSSLSTLFSSFNIYFKFSSSLSSPNTK